MLVIFIAIAYVRTRGIVEQEMVRPINRRLIFRPKTKKVDGIKSFNDGRNLTLTSTAGLTHHYHHTRSPDLKILERKNILDHFQLIAWVRPKRPYQLENTSFCTITEVRQH